MLNTFHGYVSTCWVSRPASRSSCRFDEFVGVGCFGCLDHRSTICRLQLMQKRWCSSTVEFVRHEMYYLRPSQELSLESIICIHLLHSAKLCGSMCGFQAAQHPATCNFGMSSCVEMRGELGTQFRQVVRCCSGQVAVLR